MGSPASQTVGEAGAHHARKRRHQDALLEVEFLDDRLLLFVGHFPFFGHAGACRRIAMPARQTATPSRITRPEAVPSTLRHEHAVEDGRHQRAESRAVSQHHRHPQRHPQVPHGQAEGQAAEPPQHAPEIAPEQRRGVRFAQHAGQIVGHQQTEHPRGDDPTEDAAHQPIGLPRPSLDAAERHIETAGCQAAQPVEHHSQCGIRCHSFISECKTCIVRGCTPVRARAYAAGRSFCPAERDGHIAGPCNSA